MSKYKITIEGDDFSVSSFGQEEEEPIDGSNIAYALMDVLAMARPKVCRISQILADVVASVLENEEDSDLPSLAPVHAAEQQFHEAAAALSNAWAAFDEKKA